MALPWTHLSPASITVHFELSIITGTRAMSGSEATRFKKVVIAFSESSIPSSMFTSMICAPPNTCWRATERASSYCPARTSFENFGEPVTLVRSPTLMKLVSGRRTRASRPLKREYASTLGGTRGGRLRTASAMAWTWSGVVPQQPPTMLTKPLSANSRRRPAVIFGVSGKAPKPSGRPALG